jgi:hypothetical protein
MTGSVRLQAQNPIAGNESFRRVHAPSEGDEMRKTILTGLAVLTILGWDRGASADEDSHPAMDKVLAKLSPEGLSGKVLGLARSEAGRRALIEALDGAVAWKTRGIERDPETHFEDYLFTRDQDGFITPRAERKDDLAKVAQEVAAAKELFTVFSRRADELAGKISGATDLDRRVKAAWQSSEYRYAVFHELSRDDDDDDKGKDPAARVDGFFKHLLEEQFESKGAELAVKPGAFADDDGAPSPEDLERRLSGREFAEERSAWIDLSERCTDAATAELLASPVAAGVLENLRERHKNDRISSARANAGDAFARRYLVESGGRYQWRPDKAGKVEELLRRAREIAREIEADESGVGEIPPEPAHPLDRKPIATDGSAASKDERRPDLIGRLTNTFVDGSTILLTIRIPSSPGEEARDVTVYAQQEAFRYVGIEKDQQKPLPGFVAHVWLKADSKDKAESVRFSREK